MYHETISLPTEKAWFKTYFLDYSPIVKVSACRPVVVVCPGGGYSGLSDREAEPIALAFASHGFHTVVLHYPVAPVRFPTALCALAKTVAWLREHAQAHHLDPSQIYACGFSAGGHLAGSLGAFWNAPFLQELTGCTPAQMQPNGQILCYPVITTGKYGILRCFDNLLGEDASQEALQLQSLELQVGPHTPPTFLWHTYTDETVNVQNSLLLASALHEANVPLEMHIYSEGNHGLALSNELTMNERGQNVVPCCQGWMDLACSWIKRNQK